MAAQRERTRRKTWSLFGDIRRVPSEYEIVTERMHYHFRKQPAPFEQDPGTPINRWYVEHREGSPLQVENWEEFRDPHGLTYRRYIEQQNERETYVDGLIDRFEEEGADVNLARGWVEALERGWLPSRYSTHVLQMVALYVGQMAPTSYVTNPAHLQAADEMRRIQRLAYRAKALSLVHYPELASSEATRELWQSDAAWQPLRELAERLLVVYDWGEAFAALNLAVKPVYDAFLNVQLAGLAAENGDILTSLMVEDLERDARRSREWSQALVAFAVEHRADNLALLQGWVEEWTPRAHAAVEALADAFAAAPKPIGGRAGTAIESHGGFLAGCGLA